MSTLTQVANDPHDSSAWLVFLELAIPATPAVRIVQNNEDITWQGNLWQGLGIETLNIDFAKGEIPNVEITVPNGNFAIGRYLDDYHAYLLENGNEGNEIIVTISVVPYKLIQQDPNCAAAFSISTQYISAKILNKDAVITVGAFNIFTIPFPNLVIGPNCNWNFKDSVCGYVGSETVCNRTLARCRQLGNSPRFGGHMGVMPLGVQVATN